MNSFPLIAVDIGNNRTKLGLFPEAPGSGFPEPSRTLTIGSPDPHLDQISSWIAAGACKALSWWIASVNRPAAAGLVDWLRDRRAEEPMVMLGAGDLPLQAAVERPDRVGVDRLLDALAANQLRRPGRPAIVVDVGTAITVDLVSAHGAFLGGAILPGLGMSARAMHAFTDLLPLIDMSELAAPPPPLGTGTVPAMRSGLFWGAVGAIRELAARLVPSPAETPDVFLTGGAGPAVAELLGPNARHVPHLTLAGIALAASAREGMK
jgi:type III pantothenate kinase